MKVKFEIKDTGIILYKNSLYKYFFHFDNPDEDIKIFLEKNTNEISKRHDLIRVIKELISILPLNVVPTKYNDLRKKSLKEIKESIEDLIEIIKELLLKIKEYKNKIAEEQKKIKSKQKGHDSAEPHI